MPASVPVRSVHGGMGCGPSKPAEGEAGGGQAVGTRGEKAVQNPAFEAGEEKGEKKGKGKEKKTKKKKKKFTREDAIAAATAIPGVPPQVIEAVAAVMYAVNELSFSGQCLNQETPSYRTSSVASIRASMHCRDLSLR